LLEQSTHVQAAFSAEPLCCLQDPAVGAAGQDHMRRGFVRGEGAQQLDTIRTGDIEVQYDDGRMPLPRRLRKDRRIFGDDYFEPQAFGNPLDEAPDARLIVNDEQAITKEVVSHLPEPDE